MASPSTRISEDVWIKAREVAERMGLPNERTALEAVFRVFHNAYISGGISSSISQKADKSNLQSSKMQFPYPSEADQDTSLSSALNSI